MTDFNKAVTDSIFATARAHAAEDMTMAEAFEIILTMARADYNNVTCGADGQALKSEALETISAFYYINVKGDKS